MREDRFAREMIKGEKIPTSTTSSVPQPLTSRVVTIKQSDLDSEQSAHFTGILQEQNYCVPDYRILTAGHNETVLGEKCLRPFLKSPQHASVGSEIELSGLNSMHIDRPMRTPDPP
jgi:hypothetical protein